MTNQKTGNTSRAPSSLQMCSPSENSSWDQNFSVYILSLNYLFYSHSPKPPKAKPVEKDWSEEVKDVVFLEPMTFDDFVEKEKSVLVMFYAPCKSTFFLIFNSNFLLES